MQEQVTQAAKLQGEAASHAASVTSLQQMAHDLQTALADERTAKTTALQQVRLCYCMHGTNDKIHFHNILHAAHSVHTRFGSVSRAQAVIACPMQWNNVQVCIAAASGVCACILTLLPL